MWTVDVIKARLIEAADIERRMIVKGMPGSGNAWPAYRFDREDMAGWDDQARLDHLEAWQGRKVTRSAEISRWEEVFFEWTAIIPENRRWLVWNWARCLAYGRSFSKWCENYGVVRMTAYNRLERVWENLVSHFSKEARVLRWPDAKTALQDEPLEAPITPKIDGVAQAAKRVEHSPFRLEKPRHLLKSDAALAEFEEHLEEVNERRRKAQLRRAKALRGVPGEVAA